MSDSIFRPESGGNPKAAQTRIGTRSATAIGGQRAHDLRIGPQPSYVDADRSYLNRVMIEPLTGAKLRPICEERRALRETARAMKSSAAVGVAGIITFGHEAQKLFERLTPDQQDAAYRETAEAIAARLNSTLTGLVVHADESAPHAHFQLPAYDLTGHPISETAKRGALRDLQTITAEVMARHCPGIERGNPKLDRLKAGASPSEVVNRSVAQLHDDLPAEIAAKEAELTEVAAKLDTNRDRLAKAEADLARAIEQNGAESAKAEKIRKRAATYEARATKAQAEADRLAAELDAARTSFGRIEDAKTRAQSDLVQIEAQKSAVGAELDGLTGAVAQKKTNIETLSARKASLQARLQSLNAL